MVWAKRVVQAVGWILLVVIVPVAMTLTWVREVIYDENQYLAVVDDLPAQPAVQNAIANRLSAEVDARLGDLEWPEFVRDVAGETSVADALLAMNIDVPTFLRDATIEVMQSPAFLSAWEAMNRQMHPVVEQILRGEDSATLTTTDGEIRVNLYPAYALLVEELAAEGVDLGDSVQVGDDDLWLTVAVGDQLIEAQQAVRVLNDASWALLVVGVVLAAVLIWSANDRWRMGMAVGLAVTIGALLLWVALIVAGPVAGDQLQTELDAAAIEVVVRETTSSLQVWTLVVAGAGLVATLVFTYLWRRTTEPGVASLEAAPR